jgi:hypothetical protein
MRISRAIIRWAALFLFASFVVPIIAAVCGEFFIKLAEEQGIYDKPTAKLGAAMTALYWFVAQTWFLVSAGFAAGLTAGLWLDPILRRWEVRNHQQPQIPTPQGEAGLLDWEIEGNASAERFGKVVARVGKDARWATRRLQFYSPLISAVNNSTLKRWLARRLAKHLTKLSGRVSRHTQAVQPETLVFQTSFLPLVGSGAVNTAADVQALRMVAASIEPAIENTRGMVEAIEGAKTGLQTMRGVTRELNAALDSVFASFDGMAAELRALLAICERVRTIANDRAADYSWLSPIESLSRQSQLSTEGTPQ